MRIAIIGPTKSCNGQTCGTMAELLLNGEPFCLFHGGQRLIAHEMDRMAAHAREGWALAAERAKETPTQCKACGHVHSGPQWAGICIGCPCQETT